MSGDGRAIDDLQSRVLLGVVVYRHCHDSSRGGELVHARKHRGEWA